MKKCVAPILSLLLALFMLCSPLATAVTMTEKDAAQKGAEVFNAWDVINHSNYHYMTTDYVSPYRMFVDDLKTKAAWNAALIAWRVATFNIESEVTHVTNEIGYYDTFIFNILYDETSQSLGTSFVSSLAKSEGDIEKHYSDVCASTWKQLCEFSAVIKTNPELNGGVVLLDKQLAADLKEIDDISEALDAIGDVADYMGYCKTALELVEKISKIQVLLQSSQETAEVFSDLFNNCTNNPILKSSLKTYRDLLANAITSAELATIFSEETLLSEVAKKMASKLYDEIIKECGKYGLMVAVGQGVGKFAANSLFNSENTIAQYYKLAAMYEFENLIKAETLSCQQAFEQNPTEATAKKFIAAYKLLYKTYLEGLDCADEFVKAVSGDIRYNRIKAIFGHSEYQGMLASIASIKNSVQFTLDYYESGSHNYYEDVLESMKSTDDDSVYPTTLDLPSVNIDPQNEMQTLQIEVPRMSDAVYSSNVTLNADVTLYGSLTLTDGTLDLNGHTLTVGSNFYHKGGTLSVNAGTLNVGGDYIMAAGVSHAGDGSAVFGNPSYGYLKMLLASDQVNVSGDFFMRADGGHENYLKAGTLRIGGDFYQTSAYSNSSSHNFDCSDSHTVIFNGADKTQHISFGSTASGFANVVFENKSIQLDSSVRGFTINEDIYLTIGTSEFGVNGTLDLGHCLDDFIYEGDFTFSGGNLLLGNNTISVGRNLNINGNLKLGSKDMSVTGQVLLSHGTLDLNGRTLTVNNNFHHMDGTLSVNAGTLNVGGDYIMAASVSRAGDGSAVFGNPSYGYLKMLLASDQVNVSGDFFMRTDGGHENYLKAGTLRIGGDFYQTSAYSNSSSHNFDCSGSHTVIFNGADKTQHISFGSTASGFANVVFENRNIQLDSSVRGFTINEDIHLNIGTSEFGVNGTLDLSHCLDDFVYEGDFTFNGGNLLLGNNTISVGRNLNLDGNLKLGSKDMSVGGQVLLSHGTLDLNGRKLTVGNNVHHKDGTLSVNTGTLNVGGDYIMAASVSRAGDGSAVFGNPSYGYLKMLFDSDQVNVSGSFFIRADSGHGNYLKAGTLRIGGDFYQASAYSNSSSHNFECTGSHTVVLNGNGVQKVNFGTSSSHFNKLILTQPHNNYEFSPEPCWNSLMDGTIEEIQISNISINKEGRTGQISGNLHCEQSLDETNAIIIVAFYNAQGKMLNTWLKGIQITDGVEFSLEGELSDSTLTKLFVLREDTFAPLCAAVDNIQ